MTKNLALAAKYRPQTFKDIVGQDLIKSVLSRAALEDKVAPAYLLSGTRGVGKTTIARIFAKALNCQTAPTGEPCNQCSACINITNGSFVDVIEMDGASNRGIDDARRLREIVSYAALEGRYKVVIIDEAHMLTREAFNALLKTLEEPPKNVTFILATTEAHKFPITILSRCQHFIFKQIPEKLIAEHLTKLLDLENIKYSAETVELIAKRASGSARDAISLLSQAIALCADELDIEKVRSLLGLTGQDFIYNILLSIYKQDYDSLREMVAELLNQGADLSFFLRELANTFRNLFLLKQAGSNIASKINASPELIKIADNFSLTFVHSAWVMILEGQKSVLSSIEPAVSLELLLYNLAILPQLLPIKELTDSSLNIEPEQKKKSEPIDLEYKEIKKIEISNEITTDNFILFLQSSELEKVLISFIKQCQIDIEDKKLFLTPKSNHIFEELFNKKVILQKLLDQWSNNCLSLELKAAINVKKSEAELKEEVKNNEFIQLLSEKFNAKLINCKYT